MVSKSQICLICKQDSNNLNPIDSSDVQIVFKQNVPIDVCNSCFGKFNLILTHLKSLKRTKNNKKAQCSICFNVSLYLFNLNEKNKDKFAEKIQYCNVQSSILPLRNVCYRCLYLTDLWYDLKKQYEVVIQDQIKAAILTSENISKLPSLKLKLTLPKNFKQEDSEMKSLNQKRRLSLSKDSSKEKFEMKSSNKKRKSDTNIEYGETENQKLQKLQRKLQLDIRDAGAYSKTTKSKRGRKSTGASSNNSINGFDEENAIGNVLKPANTYFTNDRKKWLKPQIRSDLKLLNEICNVDLSTSSISQRVLKRLEERKFVKVKPITSDTENNEQQSPLSVPTTTSSTKKSTKKFTAARKFPKDVPKTKRIFQSELEEIRSSRGIDSSSCKSPVSDRTDFDYGINRHSYDAFSTDKEKVVMVLLHNVDQFDKKKINKRVSDDITSVTSSSTEGDGDDDYIDEDEERLGRFSCLENYMAGLPRLILHRMDSDVNDLNAKVSKKIKKNISFKDSPSKDDTEEFITPERNPSFEEIKREIERKVKERMAQKNLMASSSNDTCAQSVTEGTTLKTISDDDNSAPEAIIDLRLSPSEDDEQDATKKNDVVVVDAEKFQTNNANGIIEIQDDNVDEVVCLNEEQIVVGSKHNGNITNNITDTEDNDNIGPGDNAIQCNIEITATDEQTNSNQSDAVQCNVEITTTEQIVSNDAESENIEKGETLNNTPMKDKQFCAVAQKLAELDA